MVYAILLPLLQLFFCSHVRLLYVIKYYLLTYLLTTRTRVICTTHVSFGSQFAMQILTVALTPKYPLPVGIRVLV